MPIPFRKLVQLVTQDLGLPLYPRSVLDGTASTLGTFQLTKKPSQTVYLTPDFRIQGALGHGRKQRIKFRQKITLRHIDQDRNADVILSDSFYDKLLVIQDQKALVEFVEKWKFSCIPREEERESLEKRYRAIGTEPANLEFLWGKVKEMQRFAVAWEKNELEEHQLLWLNRELELVSPLCISYDGHTMQSVRTPKNKLSDELNDIVGMRKAKSLRPFLGYRVYGHFALCCLELLHDMENGLQVFSCTNCGAIRKRKQSEKRHMCTKHESKKCVLERQRKRQQKTRNKG